MPSHTKKERDKSKDAKPSDLGTGAAARVGKKLKKRRSRLDAIESAATGGKPRKKMKKTKGRR